MSCQNPVTTIEGACMAEIPRLTTERLLLRPFSLADAQDVSERALADTTTLPHPYEDGMAEKWISRHQKHFDGTEAAAAVLRYAFLEMGLVRIHACHVSRNLASGRVLQKIGMQYEGRRRLHSIRWGIPEDLDLYGILKEDWERECSAIGGVL